MSNPGAGVLAVMPLHTISEVYGEAGLRERLLLEIAGLPGPERLTDALELAAHLHRDDRYGREPYLSHLLRVTIRIVSHYEVRDSDLVVAGLLHDAVEDHPEELAGDRDGDARTAALAALADRFGARVADIVAAVTNPEPDPERDKHEQYRDHIAADLDRAPWARIVKLSDFTDNGVGILYATGPAMTKLATKYRPLTDIYRDLVTRPDTPLAQHVKQRILDQLDRADERFDAILAD
ncbi:HD domain-containing protein [Nocardia arizonensis]|uniref:HD domain-containing protein n=1 Tax=Nocardia arizonensis TaxID=1141647 RepID=UPI0006D0C3C4|nr:HD domain-containing protein [Nocardia arizonensis]